MPNRIVAFVLFCMLSIQLVSAACVKTSDELIPVNKYYAGTEKLFATDLHKALNNIIKGHKAFKYSPCLWSILKESDVDPRNTNNVIGFYTRRSIKKSRQVSGRGNSNDWNREHIWAKSHGFKSRNQFAHTDAHHIRATDVSVNADRGNRDFANGGKPNKECQQCKMATLSNGAAGTWESPDVVKGDTARMMFYMAVRYDGNDKSQTPDLVLVDSTTKVGEPRFGQLCTLLAWHKRDPVSSEERLRNEVIYKWQGNRNPFIDHPEFADLIWAGKCGLKQPATAVPGDKTLILEHIERIESELKQLRNRVMSLQ